MFSKRLIEAIAKKGVSRYKIAQDTKITEATLSNYCNGKGSPNLSIVKQLSNYFEVDYDWLLGKDANKNDALAVASDNTTDKYRKRQKTYAKGDLKSIINYFEEQLKTKDELLKNNEENISLRLSIIEEKLDLLINSRKVGKK